MHQGLYDKAKIIIEQDACMNSMMHCALVPGDRHIWYWPIGCPPTGRGWYELGEDLVPYSTILCLIA